MSQGKTETLVLTSSNQLSTLHQWFTFVRLPITYLTSLMMPFPPSLLTEPFKPGNMKVVWNLRLNIGSEGPALIVWTASKCWKKNTLFVSHWHLLTSHGKLYSVFPKFDLHTSMRPPQVRSITFIPYTCYIYHVAPEQFWTLVCLATLSGQLWPYM